MFFKLSCESVRCIMFLGRNEELNKMNQLLISNKTSIINLVGLAGMGKTTLAKKYSEVYGSKYSHIETVFQCEIGMNLSFPPSTLLILDEADFIIPDVINQITLKNKGIHIVVISRQVNRLLISNTNDFCNIITLTPLNKNESLGFFSDIVEIAADTVMQYVTATGGNPALISMTIDLIRKLGLTYVEKLIFESSIKDKNGIILSEKTIETPTLSIIKTDVSRINYQLMKYIAGKPEYMHKLSPFEFEEMIANLFMELGYTVELTQRTRDGGKDIFVAQKNDIGSFLFFVECKKYAPNRPVGIDVVRNLYGVIGMENQRATGGIIATTSRFTKGVKKEIITSRLEHRISLHDYEYICSLLKKAYLD